MSPALAPDFLNRIVALRPALRRQAAFLIGRRTEIGSPDDLVQDTLVTALQTGHRFEDDNLAGWLLAILHGHVRNARRRAHVRTSVPLPGPDDAADGDAGAAIEFPVAATQELPLHLNDVMTALRTLSGNSVRFLERGDLPTVRVNLERIAQLADRMGRITGELRAFARKSTGEPQAVGLRAALTNALALLEPRILQVGAQWVLDVADPEPVAWCDGNRLEQVLVNLINNALVHAFGYRDTGTISLSARAT